MIRDSGMKRACRSDGIAPGVLLGVAALLVLAGGAGSSAAVREVDSLSVVVDEADSSIGPWIRGICAEAMGGIETFFGLPYARSVRVRIFPDRTALTAYWRSAWGVPDLQVECWQVASGTSSLLAILSPRAWKKEACEHDAADTTGTALLVAHELVHVFHAQRSSRPEFDGMEEISWLVEGVATYASGQLDRIHARAARSAIDAGAEPSVLAKAWSGRYRYGVSGSLVKYIDSAYGRAMVVALLGVTSQEEVLRKLGIGEKALLKRWHDWVISQSGG